MNPKWFSIIGLSLDILGTAIVLCSVIKRPREILEEPISYVPLSLLFTEEGKKQIPRIKERLRQVWAAIIGLVLLLLGFLLQMVGNWP